MIIKESIKINQLILNIFDKKNIYLNDIADIVITNNDVTYQNLISLIESCLKLGKKIINKQIYKISPNHNTIYYFIRAEKEILNKINTYLRRTM